MEHALYLDWDAPASHSVFRENQKNYLTTGLNRLHYKRTGGDCPPSVVQSHQGESPWLLISQSFPGLDVSGHSIFRDTMYDAQHATALHRSRAIMSCLGLLVIVMTGTASVEHRDMCSLKI